MKSKLLALIAVLCLASLAAAAPSIVVDPASVTFGSRNWGTGLTAVGTFEFDVVLGSYATPGDGGVGSTVVTTGGADGVAGEAIRIFDMGAQITDMSGNPVPQLMGTIGEPNVTNGGDTGWHIHYFSDLFQNGAEPNWDSWVDIQPALAWNTALAVQPNKSNGGMEDVDGTPGYSSADKYKWGVLLDPVRVSTLADGQIVAHYIYMWDGTDPATMDPFKIHLTGPTLAFGQAKFTLDDNSEVFASTQDLVIPEPATMGLLGLGLIGLVIRRKK